MICTDTCHSERDISDNTSQANITPTCETDRPGGLLREAIVNRYNYCYEVTAVCNDIGFRLHRGVPRINGILVRLNILDFVSSYSTWVRRLAFEFVCKRYS